jgi:leucyl-tRNA synthetase
MTDTASDTTERYNFREVEARWQAEWEKRGTFVAREEPGKPKAYVLEMFPYPSGRIHMGHVKNWVLGDVCARYRRALGYNVLRPMGWDAFGLPAENAALERGIHPAEWTYANIDAMRAQFKSLGYAIDWTRELATCDPSYYKHEQRMFLAFLKAGLAYRKESFVNWDPVDHTVLANEQVIDGRGWRTGAPVERRSLNQWALKITAYAEDLLTSLATLPNWPEKVRTMQENWIGRSTGLRLRWDISESERRIEVYTTRPDTLFGASFLAISADHPLAAELAADTAHDPGSHGNGRETGLRHRAEGEAPLRRDVGAAGLHRQLRADGIRHRRDLRLPRARPARSRLRQQIRPAGQGGGRARKRRSRPLYRRQ